jgi:carbon monoxide dehydrogenase subunit G
MLLKVKEELHLEAAPGEVWALLRDTARLAGLLPGVESVTPIAAAEGEAYAARASEKVGPFKITLNLEVRVTEVQEGSVLKAAIKGGDSVGLNRVTGSLQIGLTPEGAGTAMHFEASIEVLGKMATLGAVPIRRRTTESFSQFAKNIQGQFAKERS